MLINRERTAALCILALALTSCGPPKEPSAGGKPLRDWVFQLASNNPDSASHREAESAIQQIGTNAFPFLLKWVREAQPRLLSDGDVVANAAAMATPAVFGALRSKAAPTVPALTEILTNGSPMASAVAAHALARIGKPGLPALITALKHPNHEVRRDAAESLLFMGAEGRPAIPALQAVQNDPDPVVRKAAAVTLEALARQETPDQGPQ